MTIPTLFASLTAATGAELDADLQFVGILGVQPGGIAGTNVLVFTPAVTSVGVPAYQQGLEVAGVLPSTNTGATTLRVGSLPTLPVYLDGGAGPGALVGGELVAGNLGVFSYDAALNSGGGGWHLVNPTLSNIGPLLDSLGSTQGDILYRGATGWTALGPGTAGSLLKTSGPAANPSWETVSAALDALGSSAQGAVLYRGATLWGLLAPGTVGQVLETGGASANPSWRNFSAGSSSGATSTISVGGSPFTYTAGSQYETVYISGGTVSAVVVNTVTLFGASPCTIRLPPGVAVTVTYSGAPTMTKTLD